MRRSFFSVVVMMALAASTAPGSGDALDESAIRAEAVSLAKRQSLMWEAAVKNDWEGLYGLVLPRMRNDISLLRYMADPHTPASQLGVRISGAATMPAPDEKVEPEKAIVSTPVVDENVEAERIIASGAAPSFQPPILSYRFAEIRFSPDGRRALLISNLTVSAMKFMGPTSTVMPLYEFWIKDADGIWYSDPGANTLIHTSGAATGHDPMEGLSVKVDPAPLAATLVEQARVASEDQRPRLLEDALWLDTLQTVRRAEELHLGDREMLRGLLDRVFAGTWKKPHIFPAMMEAARWYLLIGEDATAYEGYSIAAILDTNSGPARAGAALAAARAGHWPEAAEHYLNFLRIDAVAGGGSSPSLEPFLSPQCRLCENIPAADGLAIAARLCGRGDYANAAAVYRFYAERHPGFASALARLKRGGEVTLTRLLGDELAGESAALTYHDASGLLHALGLRIAHPDDIPAGGKLPRGGVTLRSSPPLSQTGFSNGYFTFVIPASGDIKAKEISFSKQSIEEGGWLLATVDGGSPRGAFHPEGADGQNPAFAAAMKEIKKGETLFAVRVGGGPLAPDPATLKALEAAGVDTAALPNPIKNFALAGVKGAKRGSARVFASDIGVFKTMDTAANDGPGAVRIIGSGPHARVRLAR